MNGKLLLREICYPRAMGQLQFRILGVRDSTAREWLRVWAGLYEADDDKEYSDLISTARRRSLSAEDYIRIGKWKDNAKAEVKWKPNVASVAYLVWKQAAEELPKCPTDNEVEAFLNDWANRTYTDKFPNGSVKKKPFGLSRATTLLHFVSGGRFPIFDSRVRTAIARLYDSPAQNDIHGYLKIFCKRFSELADLCETKDDLRRLDKALFSYGKSEKLIRKLRPLGLDWSQCPAVESVPGKVSGAWVLKGTRMPVAVIFENIEAGANIDNIMEWFDGLDREQVKAVIEFAARSLDKPPEYAR
jgi:uncharacterized protein (DUF433 family)